MDQSQGGKAVSDEHYCPRCNAPFLCFNGVNTRNFKCGSSTQIPSVACGYASQLQERIKQLEEENDAMRADLLLWREDKWRE
jgi:hypothetical protein